MRKGSKKYLQSWLAQWLGDDDLKQLFKNTGLLLSGVGAATLLTIGSNILAARQLGSSNFGILALLSSYALIMFELFTFQSWQALIHYGTQALESKRHEDLKSLIKLGFLLDLTGSLLGAGLAIVGAGIFGHLKNWDPAVFRFTTLFGLTILFRQTSTATAILRMFDRFHLFPLQQTLRAGLRFAGVLILYIRRVDLSGFVYLWVGTEIISYMILFALGWKELRRGGYKNIFRSPLRGISHKFPGLPKFVITTNFQGSLRMIVREFDVLFVGGILGTSSAGLYKIVRQFSQLLQKLTTPIYQAIYPQLVKTWGRYEIVRFRRLIQKPAIIMGITGGLIWLSFLFFGRWALQITVGTAYSAAYVPTLIFMAGILLSMISFPFQPAMLAMGLPGKAFRIFLSCSVLYVGLLVALTILWDIKGTALALVGFYLVWALVMGANIFSRIETYQERLDGTKS